MIVSMEANLKEGLSLLNSSKIATKLMGASSYSNMLLLGASWQQGLLPLSHNALIHAIKLNGAFVEQNLRAFEIGRWAALFPDDANKMISNPIVNLKKSLSDRIDFRTKHLESFQGKSLSKKYIDLVDSFKDQEIKETLDKFNVDGFPSIKLLKDGNDPSQAIDYDAKPQIDSLNQFVSTVL